MVPSLGFYFDFPLLKYFLCNGIHLIGWLKAGKFVIRKEALRAELSHFVAISVEDDTEGCSVEIEQRHCELE